MKKVFYATLIGLLWLLVACQVEAKKINFGHDACSFCKMTIVDQQHAAQYVTKKGKQFKFDAIECMVNDLSEKDRSEIAILLSADYGEPGSMTDATTATYLISKKIKSPMGAFLSGFSSNEKALHTQKESGGHLYTWKELLVKFDVE